MVSTQVGFFAQLKGKLTVQRYHGATIFVDHYSRLRFVHLMRILRPTKHQGQARLRTVRRRPRRENPALPLRQQPICGQRIQRIMRELPPEAYLLRRERPFPKWNRRTRDKRPLGERSQTVAARARPLAGSSTPGPMAICFAQCRAPIQHPAGAGGRHVKAGEVQLNSC